MLDGPEVEIGLVLNVLGRVCPSWKFTPMSSKRAINSPHCSPPGPPTALTCDYLDALTWLANVISY